MPRPISFEQAKAQFVHRYTMEHVPAWARVHVVEPINLQKRWYAPQFRTDREWYDATLFHGESALATRKHCYTSGQTWPMGRWLDKPL